MYLLSSLFPIVRVTGHNDYTDTKPCPCFDVKADQDIQDAWNFGRHHNFAVTFPLRTELTRAFYLAKSKAKVVSSLTKLFRSIFNDSRLFIITHIFAH